MTTQTESKLLLQLRKTRAAMAEISATVCRLLDAERNGITTCMREVETAIEQRGEGEYIANIHKMSEEAASALRGAQESKKLQEPTILSLDEAQRAFELDALECVRRGDAVVKFERQTRDKSLYYYGDTTMMFHLWCQAKGVKVQ